MDHSESFTLLGDIGGTNARFALAHRGRIDEAANFRVVEFDGPLEALRRFLAAHGSDRRVLHGRLAVAGPVSGGRARLTNGAWEFDADALARSLGLDLVELVNDFEALAWSLPRLGPDGARRIGGGGGGGGGAPGPRPRGFLQGDRRGGRACGTRGRGTRHRRGGARRSLARGAPRARAVLRSVGRERSEHRAHLGRARRGLSPGRHRAALPRLSRPLRIPAPLRAQRAPER